MSLAFLCTITDDTFTELLALRLPNCPCPFSNVYWASAFTLGLFAETLLKQIGKGRPARVWALCRSILYQEVFFFLRFPYLLFSCIFMTVVFWFPHKTSLFILPSPRLVPTYARNRNLGYFFPLIPESQSKHVSHKMLVDFVFPDFQGHLYYEIQRFGFGEFAFALG